MFIFLPAQTKNTIKTPDIVLNPSCLCHRRQSRHRTSPGHSDAMSGSYLIQLQVVLRENCNTSFAKMTPIRK